MRTKMLALAVGGLIFWGYCPLLKAQSLGDVARKLRAEESRQPKATKVYTNDNLPKATTISEDAASPSTEASEQKPAAPSEGARPEESKASSTEAAASAPASEDKKKTKDYWQGQFKEARANLDRAQEELKLAEDELTLLQMQEARELDPNTKTQLGDKVSAKLMEVDNKRQIVDKAKQVLADLQKEFEDSGAPQDWMKTD